MSDVFTVAFPKSVVETKFRGHEETINERLVKLLAFDVSPQTREVWKREVKRHLRYLSGLRIKPDAKMVPERDIRRWLYSDPFDGNEAGYTAALIGLNSDEYPRNDATPAAVAGQIKAFWDRVIPSLASGEPPRGFNE